MRLTSALYAVFLLASCLSITHAQDDNSTTAEPPVTAASDNTNLTVPEESPALEVEPSDFFTTPCDTNDNCTDAGLEQTVCAADATGTKMCRCNVEGYWKRDETENKCLLQQSLGGMCQDGLSVCTDANAECMDDGSNTGTERCKCKNLGTDFVGVKKDDGTYVCAKILTRTIDITCTECIDNEGVCYNMPDADGTFGDVRSGCGCPVSRSGENCEIVHVEVKCDLKLFTMNVCYLPHGDLAGKELSMYTDGYGTVPECKAQLLTAESADCLAGSYEVMLSMRENERKTCGTRSLSGGKNTMKFENMIVVQDSPDSANWKLFKTYCSFNTHAQMSTGGTNVNGINGNDRGEHIDPLLMFSVGNQLDKEIPDGVAIRLNDKVRFKLELDTTNGTYAAIKALTCTASSSGTIPDPKARTIPLLIDGCPAEDQTIMTEDNRFRRRHNDPTRLETGLIRMFKTTKSSTVFIHCAVQLCLVGSEDDCRDSVCNGPSNNRKRRSTVDSEQEVQMRLQVFDPETETSKSVSNVMLTTTGFALVISMVVGIVVVAMVVAAIFAYKAKTRGNKVGDNVELSQNPPQRFALPRINRNHMRL